jgi:hypothetical protein
LCASFNTVNKIVGVFVRFSCAASLELLLTRLAT